MIYTTCNHQGKNELTVFLFSKNTGEIFISLEACKQCRKSIRGIEQDFLKLHTENNQRKSNKNLSHQSANQPVTYPQVNSPLLAPPSPNGGRGASLSEARRAVDPVGKSLAHTKGLR